MANRWMNGMRGIELNYESGGDFVPPLQGGEICYLMIPGPALRSSPGYHFAGFQPERGRDYLLDQQSRHLSGISRRTSLALLGKVGALHHHLMTPTRCLAVPALRAMTYPPANTG
jgi:hypothetical protein